jgi:copper chaperone CopZ
MKKIEFKIEWMTCGWCSGWVAWTLKWTNWIETAEVSHETKLAQVEFNEDIISKDDIFKIIKNMNYIPSDI